MTTEVSTSPRGWRGSATRRGILIANGVYIFPKAPERHAWGIGESRQCGFGRHELPLSYGNQLPDGHTIARDDEGFSPVQSPHDSSAVVAELSLGDPVAHGVIVARTLHD